MPAGPTSFVPQLDETTLKAPTATTVAEMAEELVEGMRNASMPLRVIFRWALDDGELAVNPTAQLRLPAVKGRRERIAASEEVRRLLTGLPERDRVLWATASHAGLRRGELLALRWETSSRSAARTRIGARRSEAEKLEQGIAAARHSRASLRRFVSAPRRRSCFPCYAGTFRGSAGMGGE